jgi:hypothetical protein
MRTGTMPPADPGERTPAEDRGGTMPGDTGFGNTVFGNTVLGKVGTATTGRTVLEEDRSQAPAVAYPEESATRAAPGEPVVTPVGVMPESVRASAGTPAPPAARAVPATAPTGGRPPGAVPPAAGRGAGRASAGELVSDVAADMSTLFRKEIELAKAEMRQSAARAGRGAGAFGGAAGVGAFALLFLLLAVMFGLGAVMALGWAALIVGCVLVLTAAGLGLFGAKAIRKVHAKPQQTVETLKEDMQWAHGLRK